MTTQMIKPLSVLIHWSESSLFKDDEQLPFAEFEQKALTAALTNVHGGYDKTSVTVMFENDHQHECRLDLGCGYDDLGFADHCLKIQEHDQKHKHDSDKRWMLEDQDHLDLIRVLKSYQFDTDLVEQARAKSNSTK